MTIIVRQNIYLSNAGQVNNEYHFWTEQGIYLGGLLLPSDRQYLYDEKALNIITKALAMRWGIIQSGNIK